MANKRRRRSAVPQSSNRFRRLTLLLCIGGQPLSECFPISLPTTVLQRLTNERRWNDFGTARSFFGVAGKLHQIVQPNRIVDSQNVHTYKITNSTGLHFADVATVVDKADSKRNKRRWLARFRRNETSAQAIWKRRHARTAVEGIRRGKTTQLNSILAKVGSYELKGRRYAARTVTGLLKAIAVEADDLEVEVDTRKNTPLWSKHVDAVRIKFSRLGFKALRMGGLKMALPAVDQRATSDYVRLVKERFLRDVPSADEAFSRIDVDNSGSLDSDELASALQLAAGGATEDLNLDRAEMMRELASDLVDLYDANGDGVVDRGEYQTMVADMAELRELQNVNGISNVTESDSDQSLPFFFRSTESTSDVINLTDSPEVLDSFSKTIGSITLSDLKLDLRRLVFGMVPILKHVVPGGHLILEPFTATITGSFTPEDIMSSFVLEDGLKRVVARVLRVRVRSLRDVIDGAVFTGRTWNAQSPTAPQVDFPDIENVEFDDKNRMIITGRARVQAYPGAPKISQAFKVRLKIGTRESGQIIRIVEPELAFVLECPESWDKSVTKLCSDLKIKRPERPPPIYSFFPIYSPFKLEDKVGGFDLGADNCIKSIFVKDNALRFEIRAVLRPGRFLGNHYLAFSVPIRTVIITMDRVKEGMRAARKQKQKLKAENKASNAQRQSRQNRPAPRDSMIPKIGPKLGKPKSFFSRFVEGYLQAEPDQSNQDRVASAIKDFFGRQSLQRR